MRAYRSLPAALNRVPLRSGAAGNPQSRTPRAVRRQCHRSRWCGGRIASQYELLLSCGGRVRIRCDAQQWAHHCHRSTRRITRPVRSSAQSVACPCGHCRLFQCYISRSRVQSPSRSTHEAAIASLAALPRELPPALADGGAAASHAGGTAATTGAPSGGRPRGHTRAVSDVYVLRPPRRCAAFHRDTVCAPAISAPPQPLGAPTERGRRTRRTCFHRDRCLSTIAGAGAVRTRGGSSFHPSMLTNTAAAVGVSGGS
jgi:hypothetical protein